MANKLPQHPFVGSVKSAPSQPAKKFVVLIGLPGDSDRPDYQRLYMTSHLNYYAEFPVSAILGTQTVPADQSPISGHEATQVTISRDATIRYVTETSPQPIDEFDLDVRLGAAQPGPEVILTGATCLDGCQPKPTVEATCFKQATCPATCANTCAGHNTCANTCPATCANTCAGHATCANTCANTCAGHATCANTCFDTCHRTCATCCGHPNTCV
jgi:hypothetical protein